jgi:hypothetical protein
MAIDALIGTCNGSHSMINKIISVFGAVRCEEQCVAQKRRSAGICGWFAAAAMMGTLPAYSHSGQFNYDSNNHVFSSSGSADHFSNDKQWQKTEICAGHEGDPAAAPEIDPGSALSGLTLLMGALAVLRGRRAKN